MAKNPKITAAVANAMMDAGIGGVVNSGKLRLYTGTQPTNAGDAITDQVLLAEFTMNTDAFPAASGGVLTANVIGPVFAAETGVAAWYRLLTSGSVAVHDGSVGTTSGNDADLLIDDTSITENDVLAITAFTITHPLA